MIFHHFFIDTYRLSARLTYMPASLSLQIPDEVSEMLDIYVERLKIERPESRTTRHSAAVGLLGVALRLAMGAAEQDESEAAAG